ncbi:hypothetical protein WICPIJ_006835 [Wickerhamomyces pijperi]|uniref:Uncharacterized protein n=1 Tax=Wickerhamomyces pijperi TaxID=599730 RepID=A0A9P8Q3Q8_WICPI|nr:hypothetical protein WICPIJ_006835 [Wickerhamomyces pijperi]
MATKKFERALNSNLLNGLTVAERIIKTVGIIKDWVEERDKGNRHSEHDLLDIKHSGCDRLVRFKSLNGNNSGVEVHDDSGSGNESRQGRQDVLIDTVIWSLEDCLDLENHRTLNEENEQKLQDIGNGRNVQVRLTDSELIEPCELSSDGVGTAKGVDNVE